MATIGTEEPQAIAVAEAIRGGDLEALRRLLDEHPGLATARLGDDNPGGMSRTLLDAGADIEAPGASSVAAPRWRTPERSGSGRRPTGWLRAGPRPPSSTPPPSGSWIAWNGASPDPHHPRRRRSTAPSGAPATVGSNRAPPTCWTGAPT